MTDKILDWLFVIMIASAMLCAVILMVCAILKIIGVIK